MRIAPKNTKFLGRPRTTSRTTSSDVEQDADGDTRANAGKEGVQYLPGQNGLLEMTRHLEPTRGMSSPVTASPSRSRFHQALEKKQ